MLLLLTLSILSCKNKPGDETVSPDIIENPATATGEKQGDLPAFDFETTNHHFGEVKAGEVLNFSFRFKNSGKADLFIVSAKASCGCTVPEYSKEVVKPGDDGKVDVSFDTRGQAGMVSKTITLIANTVPNTKVLTISAEVTAK